MKKSAKIDQIRRFFEESDVQATLKFNPIVGAERRERINRETEIDREMKKV